MADRMVETGTVIVTGGAGGIGKAIVRRLLDMGLSVFIVDADESPSTRSCRNSALDRAGWRVAGRT
jgi:NAD(P)-dependent dehydrogenase (short-subunit alcohol dehydrogenase family)